VIPGDWQIVSMSALALLIVAGALIAFRPKKRNRHVTLPPPSPACKRNSTQAVTR
jgi:hypothetical protein